jgi:hypothetical protein
MNAAAAHQNRLADVAIDLGGAAAPDVPAIRNVRRIPAGAAGCGTPAMPVAAAADCFVASPTPPVENTSMPGADASPELEHAVRPSGCGKPACPR